jgi:hypothetical protein
VINEEEAIVIDIILGWIESYMTMMECMMQVITDMVPELQPERERVKRGTLIEDGDKEVAKLTSSLHSTGLL